MVAIKNDGSWAGETFTDWELNYVNDKGVIDDGLKPWIKSIKGYEETVENGGVFGQDLDGDTKKGLVASSLDTVSTDTFGDSLKKDTSTGALYIVKESDGTVIEIKDQMGGNPQFDWSESGGSGDWAWSHSSAAYAVEDYTTASGETKYLLAVKGTDTFGGQSDTFWETYKISQNSSTNEWQLDWSDATFSSSIGKKESIFGQDMDGGGIWSLSAVEAYAITESGTTNSDPDGNVTDTSTTGITGVTLTADANGALYISKGESNIAIVDSNDSAVSFDWTDTWGPQSHTSKAWAVEGIDSNSDSVIDKYKLAVKHTFVDKDTSASETSWETIEIATTGVVDWNSSTYGDIKIHEADINQDLDSSGIIGVSSTAV